MTDRYPYRHHGPAVHGSKLTDYLISEANMIEDIEQLRAENALLPCPFCGGSNLAVRETHGWIEYISLGNRMTMEVALR